MKIKTQITNISIIKATIKALSSERPMAPRINPKRNAEPKPIPKGRSAHAFHPRVQAPIVNPISAMRNIIFFYPLFYFQYHFSPLNRGVLDNCLTDNLRKTDIYNYY